MIWIRVLVYTVVFLLIDLYFFQSLRNLLINTNQNNRNLIVSIYWLIAILEIGVGISFFYLPTDQFKEFKLYSLSVVFVLMLGKLIGCVPIFIEDITRLLKWFFQFFSPAYFSNQSVTMSRSEFISKLAILSAALPIVTLGYGMVKGAFNYQLRKHKIPIKGLGASFEGLKIVQISDIHIGSFLSKTPLKRAVDLINKQEADIVLFTGDLVNNLASEAEEFIPILKEIRAPMGVFSVLGNHDYGHYFKWPNEIKRIENLNRLKEIQKEIGWKLLENENWILEKGGENMAILGVENWSSIMRFPKYGNLEKASKGIDEISLKILMSHDPSHWDAEVNQKYKDISITFSGHTHGMQFGIEIPGIKWSPVQYVYKQWAGLYRKGDQFLHVNRGLGILGFMGRVGMRPEITVVELVKA